MTSLVGVVIFVLFRLIIVLLCFVLTELLRLLLCNR